MIHCTINFNTITAHAFHVNVSVAWVNIIPLAIYFDGIPEMHFTKSTRFTEH